MEQTETAAPTLLHTSMPETMSSSSMEFRHLLEKIDAPHKPCDSCDWSLHPSYTTVRLPYSHVCRHRYTNACLEYERQFQSELANLMMAHTSAFECAHLNSHLAINSLWPPLHNHAEQLATRRTFYCLTQRQKERIYVLLNTTIK